ncbi:ImmA/IrrE family metallo-endopeptidase [Lacticaseibacillus suilingensis]|uniref:ImmA/IrrE family metallo-endopeptidase n=1 Tax=Lacticaseibacillus suilingensis TaxID=2799577 RepID=UPI0022E25C7C|nr:ImmA/IrrE family metallo-endopeptidase [Lacticaseibacillus suilingensis]
MSFASNQADRIHNRIRSLTYSADTPELACRALDIDVINVYMPDTTYGQSVISNRCKTIFVDQEIEYGFRSFVIFHELGHCMMHLNESTPFMRSSMVGGWIPRIEREANEFSLRYLLDGLEPDTIRAMSKSQIVDYLGVPQSYTRFVVY